MHIDDLRIRGWLQERLEGTQNRVEITRKEQLRILTRLTDAVTLLSKRIAGFMPMRARDA